MQSMTIMIPLDNGRLSKHLGRCEAFAYVKVEKATRTVLSKTKSLPLRHHPGLIPHWVMEEGADIVIAVGIGRHAQQIFAAPGIEVFVGAPEYLPGTVALMYLYGDLVTGPNPCEHCEHSVVVMTNITQSNTRSPRLDYLKGCA